MRIGIDAMGSDIAPRHEVLGAVWSRQLLGPDDRIVLVGDEGPIREELASQNGWESFIEVRHTDQVIEMDEKPVEALRAKPRASLAVLTEMHKHGELDACVSAGNTGAFVAAAQMRLRRLRNVHRPGIAIITPTPRGPVAVCDVGANVSCRPQHLYQYGVMSSVYLQLVHKIESPRVGLLSIGEEDTKGNELVKAARELMRDSGRLNFVGNVESRDLFSGVCDVLICDGFVGNVVLKLIEGMASTIIRGLMAELVTAAPEGAGLVKEAALSMAGKYDFNEYGGAPLLGVDGFCVICHGASDDRGIMNAVRVARELVSQEVNEKITESLA